MKLWRDASERLTLDLASVTTEEYPNVCKDLVTAFSLVQKTPLILGLDQMFWDFRRGDQVIGLDWDPWMGFMVVAKTQSAESLVQEIAEWLRTNRWKRADRLFGPNL